MKGHVHRLGAAGNAAALLILVLMAAVLAKPFDVPPRGAPTTTAASGPLPRLVVLVVVDGLRADVARDPRVMPALCDLAARGGAGTARVEALIPSSVAGVTTLATGAVPHPASFLHDFRAPPARAGGLFERLAARGDRSFVAGARLWSDLYGRWANVVHAAPALGDADEPALRAGLAALDDPGYRFGVFHFGATDEAAHLHGSGSAEYARAAAWCDDAVRQIVERAGPAAAIVVTSDHGVTDAGGHAGPEPEVLDTPVVTFGPGLPAGALPPLAQRDVPQVIARALGIESLPPVTPDHANRSLLARRSVAAGLAALAGVCAVTIWAALATGIPGWPHAPRLALALWLSLGLLVAGQFTVAAGLATGVLAASAVVVLRRRGARPLAAGPLFAVAIGGAWALLRIRLEWGGGSDALGRVLIPVSIVLLLALWWRSRRNLPGVPAIATGVVGVVVAQLVGGAGVALTFAVGFAIAGLIGVHFQRKAEAAELEDEGRVATTCWPGFAVGTSLALGTSFAAIAAGQSLSLSTLDVSTAYHAALHGGGLPVAIAVVFLSQALPPVALAAGFMLPSRRWSPAAAGAVFVGMSAVLAGEALAAAGCLLGADDLRIQSLSLGGLLRSAVGMIFLNCGAGVVLLTRRPEAPEIT